MQGPTARELESDPSTSRTAPGRHSGPVGRGARVGEDGLLWIELCPPLNLFVEVLTPSVSECDHI